MREYGKVSPQFWIGKTGKALRGNPEAQLLALYLMTSPHANMIGVFHCPIAYMAHETGLTIEGASKGLECLIKADFCTFDADDEYVFVHQFALHQVGESLLPTDKRCKGVENELSKVPKNQCWQAFRARYAEPFNLPIKSTKASPLQAPLQAPQKPETGAGAETGAEDKGTTYLLSAVQPPTELPDCPHHDLIDLYRKLLPTLPTVRKELWDGAKADNLRARWKWVLTAKRESGERYAETREQALEWFTRFFEEVGESDFLSGRNGAWTKCDLAWLVKSDNFRKVVQGNYKNGR